MTELDEVKLETANIVTRLENVEGYFSNFDTTLNNHMTDYDRKLTGLRRNFMWGFWVLFSLFMVAFGGY